MAVELVLGEEVLSVDAVIREGHGLSSRVSAFPTESGGTISDNLVNDPDVVSIESIVTNHPLTGGFVDAVGEAFRVLSNLRAARQVVTVVTGLKVYRNMAILRVSIPIDVDTGSAMRFSATFQQIERVTTRAVELPPEQVQPGKSRDQGASSFDGGKQSTKDVAPSAEPPSLLFMLFN